MHIEKLEQIHLIGIRVCCPAEEYLSEIPQASKRLEERKHKISHVTNPTQQIGAFIVETSSEDEEGYWVCVQVKKVGQIPNGMVSLTIPPQTYAVMNHNGPNTTILHTYDELHNRIEKSGKTRKIGAWHLERFHHFKNKEKIDVDLLDTIQ
ncbi:GyrI-like domain-containing protein [Bacillus sp. N1-1]|uniref:GyrI-like domain-containing protein n=1 Tax=Bacillus sp. N1-1 TaxID=2682541 RepID=UPI001317BB0A|nr:GyrI-like domain-containing protein [Bacillus sp. N1-1]QHA90887.1 AraC family transcriptional regulator [Bacillus sp. N1-1]